MPSFSDGEKIARMVMWVPLLAGALAVVASQRYVLLRWARDLMDHSTEAAGRSEKFARSLVGKSQKEITRLIGSSAATARSSRGQEQWYYLVNSRDRTALAITFDGDRVQSATMLRGMRQTSPLQIKAIT